MSTHKYSKAWWKSASIYQIYPASFKDSNGDGYGDLPGIIEKLDYIKELGIDVLWLCPIYKSPQHDMGYDISDYEAIWEPYGTMEDFDRLLKGAHDKGMKLIMDLVVNHTSDEHAWFESSRSSKTDPKRDWYIWRKGKTDTNGERSPPNNWRSVFGGPAWKYDEKTDEWFLHLFCPEQPDLNWETEAVREAVYSLMRFWLDKGVDGFRMDVINLISKVPGLPDAEILEPNEPTQPPFALTANGPRVHEFLKEMHREVLSKYDILTVGETPFSHDPKVLIPYTLPSEKELQMVFQFELHDLDGSEEHPMKQRAWKLSELKQIVTKWQVSMIEAGGWNSLYLENHDQARSITRFCSDSPKHRTHSATLLSLLHCTLSGTIYLYQSEELGQINMPPSWGHEEYKDVATKNYWRRVYEERKREGGGKGEEPDMSDVMKDLRQKARDNARTPVQWNRDAQAGFTTGTPWMRVHEDYQEGWNAEDEAKDPNSPLNYWKRMLKLRKEHDILVYGDFTDLDPSHEQVFIYRRRLDSKTALVVLNFKAEPIEYRLPDSLLEQESTGLGGARVLVGNYEDFEKGEMLFLEGKEKEGKSVKLRAFEGKVFVY